MEQAIKEKKYQGQIINCVTSICQIHLVDRMINTTKLQNKSMNCLIAAEFTFSSMIKIIFDAINSEH